MEQRRLRLGDILDDYCPRERRVTNHAIVAMIEENVKQTRCTTCDAEHAYKAARVPARRKKESASALYKEVLAGMPEVETGPVLAAPLPAVSAPLAPVSPLVPISDVALGSPAGEHAVARAEAEPVSAAAEEEDDVDAEDEYDVPPGENGEAPAEGPVHRRLIRATLPRIEGQKEARPVPDFTIRQTPPRGSGNGYGHNGGRERMRMRGPQGGNGNSGAHYGSPAGSRSQGAGRFQGNRPPGGGRPGGRPGGGANFRGNGNAFGHGHGNGNGPGANGNKRGRGSRG